MKRKVTVVYIFYLTLGAILTSIYIDRFVYGQSIALKFGQYLGLIERNLTFSGAIAIMLAIILIIIQIASLIQIFLLFAKDSEKTQKNKKYAIILSVALLWSLAVSWHNVFAIIDYIQIILGY